MAVSKREDAKIGVGIVGTGMWANTHARACKANPHAEIVGLAEIREGAAESFAQDHDIDAPISADYREQLEHRRVLWEGATPSAVGSVDSDSGWDLCVTSVPLRRRHS